MAKMYFKYGAMKSGKSMDLIRTYDTYTIQGKKVLTIVPTTDDRYEIGKVTSRSLGQLDAVAIEPGRVAAYFSMYDFPMRFVDVILLDEAQFFLKEDILSLREVVNKLDVPVVAFGLKNDFMNNLFEGSEALVIYADKLDEIKTTCSFCGSKATMNLRLIDGRPIYIGEQIAVGDEEYLPVCSKHWFMPNIEEVK